MDLPPPLTDVSPAGLRDACEADSVATRVLGAELWSEPHLDPDAAWVVGPPMDPLRSVVVSARFDPATADERIAAIVARFDAVPTPFVWWRAPFHGPGDLADRLEAAHIYPVGAAPAMAMDLGRLPGIEVPAGVAIEGVRTADDLREYLEVLAAEPPVPGVPPLYPPEKIEPVVAHVAPGLPGEPLPFRYIARIDGRPVAAARVSVLGGVAGLYSVATLPEFRGRGLGRAVTLAALHAGRELGYRIGTLQSSDMGYGIYRRLGFEDVFTYRISAHLPGGARFVRG